MDLESGIRDDDANMKLIQREYLPGEQVTYIKDLIEHAHKNGLDIPDKLKDYLKTTSLSK